MTFDNYIKPVAETICQVCEEMTGQMALGIKTERLGASFSAVNYKTAIVVPFENKKEKLKGRFVLGFNDEAVAENLAADIADFAGMQSVGALDDMATDVLFEFMNIIAGKAVAQWDTMGLDVDFAQPELINDLNLHDGRDVEVTIHSVSLYLKENMKLAFLVTIEEKNKTVLNNKKVLVVDDSKMIRLILSKEFVKEGCEVCEAVNGLDGFIKCHSFQPDLIIMDLNMPKMGGLEATAKIREINPTIPIIILTSSSKKEEVIAAAAHKIKGFIKKPIKMDQLLKLAEGCFQK